MKIITMWARFSTPCSKVCSYHYSQKLSSYNQTVLSLVSGDATAYLWDDQKAIRVAEKLPQYQTSIFQIWKVRIIKLQSIQTHVAVRIGISILRQVYGFLSRRVRIYTKSKYLESGHSQMEVGNIHSLIERRKKSIDVYAPYEWQNVVISTSRMNNSISVIPLQHTDFSGVFITE